MKRPYFRAAAVMGALVLSLTGCFNKNANTMSGMDHSTMDHSSMNQPSTAAAGASAAITVKPTTIRQTEFTLTAQASNLEVEPGVKLPVWTFNNSVPGPEIRVKQGDKVKITLKNELPEPVAIHWHGLPVPFAVDGIPGMTQNAVQPGQSYTYEFTASAVGTYWYHSHQDSVNQIDRGLYGALIVEPKEDTVTRDYTLMLDEWMSSEIGKTGYAAADGMSGMDHSMMNMNHSMAGMASTSPAAAADAHSGHSGSGGSAAAPSSAGTSAGTAHDMSMYDLLTINGKTGSGVENLPVKQGDHVRLRLINAGYKTHTLHLHGHEWKVTATDGQPVNQPQLLKDTLLAIAPGERYDIEFEANNPGQWYLEDHGSEPGVKGMKIKLAYEGSAESKDQPNDALTSLPVFSFTQYGRPAQAAFTLEQQYDVTYTMELGTGTKAGATVYTINGKTFPDTDPIRVKKGDKVLVKLVNRSEADLHPMHLHGHLFQVLSRNDKPLAGSPIVKDTLNLLPGEEYVVAFEADNPGDWMFHCHDLHHATAGMITELDYTDFTNTFTPDPNAGNKPE